VGDRPLHLRVAALGTAIILPLGVAAAALLARRRGVGRTVLDTLFSLPLVLPPTAVGVVLLDALSARARWGAGSRPRASGSRSIGRAWCSPPR
jgi:molybdate transport system permease protein